MGNACVAPLHDLHRAFSHPGLLPKIETSSHSNSRAPTGYSLRHGEDGGPPLTAATLSSKHSNLSRLSGVSRRSIRSATAAAVSAAVNELHHDTSSPDVKRMLGPSRDAPKVPRRQRLETMLLRS